MGLTSQEKQAARRERLEAQGIVPLSVEVPRKVAASLAAEAKVRGKTRSQVATERLSAKPKPVVALPKDISKEADRIVHLIGKGLRATITNKAAGDALSDAMDAIYGLAGMVASRKAATPATKRSSKAATPVAKRSPKAATPATKRSSKKKSQTRGPRRKK